MKFHKVTVRPVSHSETDAAITVPESGGVESLDPALAIAEVVNSIGAFGKLPYMIDVSVD